MKDHHVHRVLGLLGDWDSRRIAQDKKYHGLLQPKWNHRTQWKWFFRDIGKYTCIVGLLPWLETALYVSQTPLPKESPFVAESPDSLQEKARLILNWVENPCKKARGAIVEKSSTLNETIRFGSPVLAAATFIDTLLRIIGSDRKFQTYVFVAFDCIVRMGYYEALPEMVFKKNVLAVYQRKLQAEST
ncbi:hypothetical protein IAD21_00976 [Abditibacteriota bacterium]|nr:hypothetical protein IAD21_00976 [Abditibacteriota bacterium]